MRRREFRGKTILITGAAGGIGTALTWRFARAGAKIGLMDLDEERLSLLESELKNQGLECFAVASDITDSNECIEAVNQCRKSLGPIDALINNAGLPQRSAFVDTTSEVYRRVMAVNFFGSLFCAQAAIGDLVDRQGMIIVTSSVAGFAPLYGRTAYAASKHALHGLFDTLRSELRADGVDVLMVCPSFVDTDFRHRALDADGSVTEHPQSTVGRIITPETTADLVFQAACRRKQTLILSPAGKAAWWLSRIAPRLYESIMTRSLRSELAR